MKYRRIIAILAAFMLLLSGCSMSKKQENQTYTDTLFDTVIKVQILDSVDSEVLEGCKELCQKYDTMFSNRIEDSEISRINNAKCNPVEVSDETLTLIKTGIYYSELSDGAFDITISRSPCSGILNPKALLFHPKKRLKKL